MKSPRLLRSSLRWLVPGMGVKRWLIVLAMGITVLSLGFSFMLRELYPLPRAFYYLTLQFVPRGWRALLFGAAGAGVVALALVQLNRSVLAPFVKLDGETVVNAVYQYRRRERGPKVVAIGGGNGLAVLLRGLKQYSSNLTAIVTVADDGGSSGRLRRELGVLPPGDFRNCIAALADDESLTTQLFQYRFAVPQAIGEEAPDSNGSGLDGHSFGNLFITAMAEVTGSFERALLESGKVLAIQGRVVPSTLQDVTLMADVVADPAGMSRVAGESQIPQTDGVISRVYLAPDEVSAYPEAVRALLEADLIVAGPGSLYTSVLPNLLVGDVARAVRASRATKVFVCNVATQRGETDGFDVGDHVEALEAHTGRGLFPLVLANDNLDVDFVPPAGVTLVLPGNSSSSTCTVVTSDLIDLAYPWRHDSQKLAGRLISLIE